MTLLIIALICALIGIGIIISNWLNTIDIDNDTNPEFYNDDNDNRRL